MTTNAFNLSGERLIPGEAWNDTVATTRHELSRKFNVHVPFDTLGSLIAGAAVTIGANEVDLAEFVKAAQPPLNRDEIVGLVHGFNLGNRLVDAGYDIETPLQIMDRMTTGVNNV